MIKYEPNKTRPADSEEQQQQGSAPSFKAPFKGKGKSKAPRPPKAQKPPSQSSALLTSTSSTAPDGMFYPDLTSYEETIIRSYEAMTAQPSTYVRWLLDYPRFHHICMQYLIASWLSMYSKKYSELGVALEPSLQTSPAKLQMVFSELQVPSTVRDAMHSTLTPCLIAGARCIPAPPRVFSQPVSADNLGNIVNYHVWCSQSVSVNWSTFDLSVYGRSNSLGYRRPASDHFEDEQDGVTYLPIENRYLSAAFRFCDTLRVFPRLFQDFAASIKSAGFPTTNFSPFDCKLEPALERVVAVREHSVAYNTSLARDRPFVLRSESPLTIQSSLTSQIHLGLTIWPPSMVEWEDNLDVTFDVDDILGDGSTWFPQSKPNSPWYAFLNVLNADGSCSIQPMDILAETQAKIRSGSYFCIRLDATTKDMDYSGATPKRVGADKDLVATPHGEYSGSVKIHVSQDKEVKVTKVHLKDVPIHYDHDGDFYFVLVKFQVGFASPGNLTTSTSLNVVPQYPLISTRFGIESEVDFLIGNLGRILRCSSAPGPWIAKIISEDLSKRY